MQVVGQPCEVCSKTIVSGMDGVGCVHCERFFHDACVLSPPPAPEAAKTYRVPDQAPALPKKRKKVRCPGCGADLRKEQRERDQRASAEREAHEERRSLVATRQQSAWSPFLLARLGFLILFLISTTLFQLCSQR